MTTHDATAGNPAWLIYLDARDFPREEFWSLLLDWNHSGEKPPERLRELSHRRMALKKEFNRTWKRR